MVVYFNKDVGKLNSQLMEKAIKYSIAIENAYLKEGKTGYNTAYRSLRIFG